MRFEIMCECGRCKKVGGAIACGLCYQEARDRAEKARQQLDAAKLEQSKCTS